MKLHRKLLAVFLALTILFSSMPILPTYADPAQSDYAIVYNPNNPADAKFLETQQKLHNIRPYITVAGKNLYLNKYWYWMSDTRLLVYGTPADAGCTWKAGWGYRYLGYNQLVQQYTNPFYPPDSGGNWSPESKSPYGNSSDIWAKRPWDNPTANEIKSQGLPQPVTKSVDPGVLESAQWTNSQGQTFYAGRDDNGNGTLDFGIKLDDLKNYIGVVQEPTDYCWGTGRMYHKISGKWWYIDVMMPQTDELPLDTPKLGIEAVPNKVNVGDTYTIKNLCDPVLPDATITEYTVNLTERQPDGKEKSLAGYPKTISVANAADFFNSCTAQKVGIFTYTVKSCKSTYQGKTLVTKDMPKSATVTVGMPPAGVVTSIIVDPDKVQFDPDNDTGNIDITVKVKGSLNMNNLDPKKLVKWTIKAKFGGTTEYPAENTHDIEGSKSTVNGNTATAEWTYTFTIPASIAKSKMLTADSFTQEFNGQAIAQYYGENIQGNEATGSTVIYKSTPPASPPEPTYNGEPPTASIDMRSEAVMGDSVSVRGNGIDKEDPPEKLTYHWKAFRESYDNSESNTGDVHGNLTGRSGSLWFSDTGIFDVDLYVTDTDGNDSPTTEASIRIIEPIPIARIAKDGTPKVNREFILDGSSSTSSQTGGSSNTRYPIDWTKSKWTITPLSGGATASDIKTNDSYSSDTMHVLFKKPGMYRATLYIENVMGNHNSTYADFYICEDAPPVPAFTISKILLREPADSNQATITVTDNTSFAEQFLDIIAKRIWLYAQDTNSNGSFDDDTWYVWNNNAWRAAGMTYAQIKAGGLDIDSIVDGNKTSVSLKGNMVGKFKFELIAKEEFGQPTIASFVTTADRRTANTFAKAEVDKVAFIRNVAPITDFSTKIINQKKVDVVVLTDYTGQKLLDLQSQLNNMKAELYPNNVDVQFSIVNTSKNIGTQALKKYIYQRYLHFIMKINNGAGTDSMMPVNGFPTYRDIGDLWEEITSYEKPLNEILFGRTYSSYRYINTTTSTTSSTTRTDRNYKVYDTAGGTMDLAFTTDYNNYGRAYYWTDYNIDSVYTDPQWIQGTYVGTDNLNVTSIDIDALKTQTLRTGSDRYAVFLSDGRSKDYSQAFGGNFAFGSLTTDIQNYITQNNFKVYTIADTKAMNTLINKEVGVDVIACDTIDDMSNAQSIVMYTTANGMYYFYHTKTAKSIVVDSSYFGTVKEILPFGLILMQDGSTKFFDGTSFKSIGITNVKSTYNIAGTNLIAVVSSNGTVSIVNSYDMSIIATIASSSFKNAVWGYSDLYPDGYIAIGDSSLVSILSYKTKTIVKTFPVNGLIAISPIDGYSFLIVDSAGVNVVKTTNMNIWRTFSISGLKEIYPKTGTTYWLETSGSDVNGYNGIYVLANSGALYRIKDKDYDLFLDTLTAAGSPFSSYSIQSILGDLPYAGLNFKTNDNKVITYDNSSNTMAAKTWDIVDMQSNTTGYISTDSDGYTSNLGGAVMIQHSNGTVECRYTIVTGHTYSHSQEDYINSYGSSPSYTITLPNGAMAKKIAPTPFGMFIIGSDNNMYKIYYTLQYGGAQTPTLSLYMSGVSDISEVYENNSLYRVMITKADGSFVSRYTLSWASNRSSVPIYSSTITNAKKVAQTKKSSFILYNDGTASNGIITNNITMTNPNAGYITLSDLLAGSEDSVAYGLGQYAQAIDDIQSKYANIIVNPSTQYFIVDEDTIQYLPSYQDYESDPKDSVNDKWMIQQKLIFTNSKYGSFLGERSSPDVTFTHDTAGEFTITYTAKDKPPGVTGPYNALWSKPKQAILIGHRRPHPSFDMVQNGASLSISPHPYDEDHLDRADKGIAAAQFFYRYTDEAAGIWHAATWTAANYGVPATIPSDKIIQVKLWVKDLEGAEASGKETTTAPVIVPNEVFSVTGSNLGAYPGQTVTLTATTNNTFSTSTYEVHAYVLGSDVELTYTGSSGSVYNWSGTYVISKDTAPDEYPIVYAIQDKATKVFKASDTKELSVSDMEVVPVRSVSLNSPSAVLKTRTSKNATGVKVQSGNLPQIAAARDMTLTGEDSVYKYWSYILDSNTLPNPSFEGGLTGWNYNASCITRANTLATQGDYSLRFYSNTVSGAISTYTDMIPVQPNTTYTLSADILNALDSGTAYLDWIEYSSSQTMTADGANIDFAPGSKGWESKSAGFTTKANTAYVQVRLIVNNAQGELLADNFKLEKQIYTLNDGSYNVSYSLYGKYGFVKPDTGTISVDRTPPAITVNPTTRNADSNDISVMVNVSDNFSGFDYFRYAWTTTNSVPDTWSEGVTNSSYNITQSNDGIWYLFVKGYDKYGNTRIVDFGQYIKAQSLLITVSPDSQDWTNMNIGVQVIITENDFNTLDSVQYAWTQTTAEPVAWETTTDTVFTTVEREEGVWYLHVKAKDRYGRYVYSLYEEPFKPYGEYKLDKTPPDIENVSPTTARLVRSMLQAIHVTFHVSDALSGVYETKYVFTTSTDKPPVGLWATSTGSTINAVLNMEGKYYLHIETFDNAGNSNYTYYGPYENYVLNITMDYKAKSTNSIFDYDSTMPAATLPASEQVKLVESGDDAKGVRITSNAELTSAQVYFNGNLTGTLVLNAPEFDGLVYTYSSSIYYYTVPAAIDDGSYNITVKANTTASDSVSINRAIRVYTPVWEDYHRGTGKRMIDDPLVNVSSELMLATTTSFEEVNFMDIMTSDYTTKLKVEITSPGKNLTFYCYKNGRFDLDGDGAGTYTSIQNVTGSNQFKVSNLQVYTSKPSEATTAGGYDYRYVFDLSLIGGYPFNDNENCMLTVTAYDASGNCIGKIGNPQTKNILALGIMLYDFKVTDVRDRAFEALFNGTGLTLPVKDLALDASDHPEGKLMKKGYAFYFTVNSKGLAAAGDTIRIQPTFYTANTHEQLDMYYATDNDAYVLATSNIGSRDPEDTIRIFYEKDLLNLLGYHNEISIPTTLRTINGSTQVWRARYGIPATAIFVKKGKEPWIDDNRITSPVIVHFDIEALKGGVPRYNYVGKGQWEKERTLISGYPVNPGKYYMYNAGDVIVIDPAHDVTDDYEAVPTHRN